MWLLADGDFSTVGCIFSLSQLLEMSWDYKILSWRWMFSPVPMLMFALCVFRVCSEHLDQRGCVCVWRSSLVLCWGSEIPVRKQHNGHAPAGQRLRCCVSEADPQALYSRTPQRHSDGTHTCPGLNLISYSVIWIKKECQFMVLREQGNRQAVSSKNLHAAVHWDYCFLLFSSDLCPSWIASGHPVVWFPVQASSQHEWAFDYYRSLHTIYHTSLQEGGRYSV